tara:strand:- start:2015 stop:3370 length:1356 start_codon:yes stop_codon:yes gene_type:complete
MAISGLTLGTQRDLTNDMLVKGIIDSIVTVNQFYQHLPFKGIQGNALAYNREAVGVDQQDLVSVMRTGVSGINKDQQTFTRHSTELTTIIGDAQVNGLIQAVGSDYNDATAVQVAAKAKGVGRKFMDLMINGQEGSATRGVVASLALTGTPALTATSATTAKNFYDTVIQGANLSAARGITPTYDLNGSGADNKGFTQANLVADTDTAAGTNTGMINVYVNGVVHKGPFASGTPTAVAITLTAAGVVLYNSALRLVNGPLGFDGLDRFVTLAARTTAPSAIDMTASGAGDTLLSRLDEYIDNIHDKDGMVDYMMMNSAGVRKYTQALRLSNAAGFDDVMEVKDSSGGVMKVQSYRGVPIYRNDFVQSTLAEQASLAGGNAGAGSGAAHVFCGTVDDGSFSHGICGLTAQNSSGIQVAKLGAREDVDAEITRVKWYVGMANFSELGIFRGQI